MSEDKGKNLNHKIDFVLYWEDCQLKVYTCYEDRGSDIKGIKNIYTYVFIDLEKDIYWVFRVLWNIIKKKGYDLHMVFNQV